MQCFYGQAVRQGLQPASIQETPPQNEKRRPTLYQEHRPSGTQLRGNIGAVAHSHQKKGIDIVVLDMPLLDTRRGKDLMGTFLSDIVLQVLSFVAENERTNIRQRQAEGIAAAKARGVRFGRPPKPLPDNFHNAYQKWKNGKTTGTTAATECGMPLATFRYRASIYEKAKLL